MGRFRLGLKLAGQSWRVLRGHPALLAFPLTAILAAIALVGPPALGGGYLWEEGDKVPAVALLLLAAYLASFITAFMGVGLVATADAIMRGEEAGFGFGLKVAMSHLGAISGWASSTPRCRSRWACSSRAGRAARSRPGWWAGPGRWSACWPCRRSRSRTPARCRRSSARRPSSRSAGPGQVTGMAAIGGLVFLLGVLPGVLIAVLGVLILSSSGGGGELAAGEIVLALGVVITAVALLISTALRQVFAAALYRYATTGHAPTAFSDADLQSAVRVARRPAGRRLTPISLRSVHATCYNLR